MALKQTYAQDPLTIFKQRMSEVNSTLYFDKPLKPSEYAEWVVQVFFPKKEIALYKQRKDEIVECARWGFEIVTEIEKVQKIENTFYKNTISKKKRSFLIKEAISNEWNICIKDMADNCREPDASLVVMDFSVVHPAKKEILIDKKMFHRLYRKYSKQLRFTSKLKNLKQDLEKKSLDFINTLLYEEKVETDYPIKVESIKYNKQKLCTIVCVRVDLTRGLKFTVHNLKFLARLRRTETISTFVDFRKMSRRSDFVHIFIDYPDYSSLITDNKKYLDKDFK
jgi:hypothetical protein